MAYIDWSLNIVLNIIISCHSLDQVCQCKMYCKSCVFILIRLGIPYKKIGFAAALLFIDEFPKEGFNSPGLVRSVRLNSLI